MDELDSGGDCAKTGATEVVRPKSARLRWQASVLVASMSVQYRTVVDGAGWVDRPDRGRLRVTGSDRMTFLQAIVSNDLEGLPAGGGAYATYLTPQGRLIADLAVMNRGDALLVDLPASVAAAVARRLDDGVFAEDVQVHDVSSDTCEILVVGGHAARALVSVATLPPEQLLEMPELWQSGSGERFVARSLDTHLPTFRLFMPASLRQEVVSTLQNSGAQEVPFALFDALRIEQGRPMFGADLTDETIPLEAGLLDRMISTTKGCYVGQEVIIRILHRGGGRVAKRLVMLTLDVQPGEQLPARGARLMIDDRDVGWLTSVAHSPRGAGAVALGYVHRDAAETGNRISVTGCAGHAEIIGLAR